MSQNVMISENINLTAARAFVRSLNILLKYTRLYGFDHTRTGQQFNTAWTELHQAIPITNESGLLLGASGAQLLLDGVPVEATPAERSFAQLLSAAGLASLQFTPKVTKEDFERLVRAFPTQNTKPSVLAEQLKSALANITSIRINEIRFVAEDASKTDAIAAGLLTAQTLGADTNAMKDWLRDPRKLLQLIAAAEGSRGEPGEGPGGAGPGAGGPYADGSGSMGGDGSGSQEGGNYSGTGGSVGGGGVPGGTGSGPGGTSNTGSGGPGTAGTGGGAGSLTQAGGTGSGSGGTARSGETSGTGAAGGSLTGGIGGPGGSGGPGSGGGTGSGAGTGGTGIGSGGSGTGSGTGVGGLGSGSGGTGLRVGEAGGGVAGGAGGGTGGGGSGVGGPGTGTGIGGRAGAGGGHGVGATGTSAGSNVGGVPVKGGAPRPGGKAGSGKSAYSGEPVGEILRGSEELLYAVPSGRGDVARVVSGLQRPTGQQGPGGAGAGMSGWTRKDDDILSILKLLTHLGSTVSGEGGTGQPGPLAEELTKLPAESQEMLRQALAAIAAQTPPVNSKDPILLRLAEHLAIKFAMERYQRGEVKVDAVRQLIEKMAQEIDGLRKILGVHEQKLAEAGVIVESTAELLDRQFWAAVPERGKRSVLTSPEAWCIPARNVRQYVEQLIQRGEDKAVLAILQNYASCVQNTDSEARRRTAIGLADLADVYSSLDGRPLPYAIRVTGAQLSVERDDNLQGLISAAFVRLTQEAGACRAFPALIQALDSLETVEHQRPVFGQTLRPRLGLEKRIPEFLEDVLRGERGIDGLDVLLRRVPRTSAESLILRFNRTSNRADMQRLTELARAVGEELMAALRDILRSGSAIEAAETAGFLSRLDPTVIQRLLPERLSDWPRQSQDRVVRLVAMGGASERGSLLVSFLRLLDPVLIPLAIDEIGLSEDAHCISSILRLAEGPPNPFVRLKAIEALGRLKAQESTEFLRGIAEGRHMFHWNHPAELRLAALQSLVKIDSNLGNELIARSGFSADDLSMAPLDPLPNAKYFRRRRYPRVRLPKLIPATTSVGLETYRLDIRGLSLSGGIAAGEKHVPPGTLVSMKIGSGLRPIRAQVMMRDARTQGLGFEFAEMDLEERARLRKLLLENMPSRKPEEQAQLTQPVS